MEVAHPHSGSSFTWLLVELEFGNVSFWGEGKTEVPREKPLGAKERTNNKLNPHNGVDARIWTQAIMVGGECSHQCATLASLGVIKWWVKQRCKRTIYYSLIEDTVLCFLLGMGLGYFFMIFWAIQRLVGLERKSLCSSYTKSAHWMSWNSCHSTLWFKQLKMNVAFDVTEFSLIHWSRQEL